MSLPKKRLEFTVAELSEEWHWGESIIFKNARLGELPLKYGAGIPLPPEVAAKFEASEFVKEVETYQDGRWLKFQRSGVYLLTEDKLAFEQSVGIHSGQAVFPSPTKTQSERNRENQSANRMDTLGRLADRTYQGLVSKGLRPTWLDVIQNLESFDEEDEVKRTIEEIRYDEEIIYWLDQRGKDRETPFKAFTKRMTRLKKKF